MKVIGSFGFIIICICVYLLHGEVEQYDKKVREFVGTQVTIKGERLEIVNYSILDRTYTLDDGSKISVSFVID